MRDSQKKRRKEGKSDYPGGKEEAEINRKREKKTQTKRAR